VSSSINAVPAIGFAGVGPDELPAFVYSDTYCTFVEESWPVQRPTRQLCVQSKGFSLSDDVDADLRCPFHIYI